MEESGICFLLVLVLAVALVIYGFVMLLKKQETNENDVTVLQRQLRGFGYLLLSQIVLVMGASLCIGLNLDSFKKMVKSVRM